MPLVTVLGGRLHHTGTIVQKRPLRFRSSVPRRRCFDVPLNDLWTVGRSLRPLGRAFTLLELLVAMVIVATLVAIAFTVYDRLRESSNVSKDASNLRQLGVCLSAYMTDYTYFPAEAWPTTLHPQYVSSRGSFQSPFDKRPRSEDVRSARLATTSTETSWDYAWCRSSRPPPAYLWLR